MEKDSEIILKAHNKKEIDLPYIMESTESKSGVDRREVKSFFSMDEDEETHNLLEEHATEEEKTSWSIEDFIVQTINNRADDAIKNAKQLVKPKSDIFAAAKGSIAHQKVVEESIQKIEQERVEQIKPEVIAKKMAAVESKPVSESTNYDPTAGDRKFQRSLKVMKRELEKDIAKMFAKESQQTAIKIESMSGGGSGGGGTGMTKQQEDDLAQSLLDINTLSATEIIDRTDIDLNRTDINTLSATEIIDRTDIDLNRTDINTLSATEIIDRTDIDLNRTDINTLSATEIIDRTDIDSLSATEIIDRADIDLNRTDINTLSATEIIDRTDIDLNRADINTLSADLHVAASAGLTASNNPIVVDVATQVITFNISQLADLP